MDNFRLSRKQKILIKRYTIQIIGTFYIHILIYKTIWI